MRLRNWHIDGFGVFSSAALPEPGLGDGLNLIVGSNAAGKSTLLDFLRYTLFGHPSGNSSLPRREPLNGGNHGGTIVYELNGETYNLFRQPTKKGAFELRDQTGTPLTIEDLESHLAGVTSEMFRSIFGFSLEELQGVESFKKAGIRDLVFAASVGQSLGQIRDTQDSLEKQANALYKEGAKATAQNPPRLVKLRADLAQVRHALTQAIDASRAVIGKVNEVEDETALLEELEIERVNVESDIQRLERLILGWPLWVQRCRAEKEREELGDVSLFPEFGDSAFVKLDTESQNTKAQALDNLTDLRSIAERLRELPSEFPLLKLASKVEELETRRTDYGIAKELGANAKTRATESEQAWQEVFEELGQDWPEQVIRKFNVSLLIEDEVRSLVKEVRNAELINSERRSSASNLARNARSLSRDCFLKAKQLHEAEQLAPLLESQEIADQRTPLAEFREALIRYESLRNDLGGARDHLTQVNLIVSQRRPLEAHVPTWISIVLAIVAVPAGVMAAGLFYAGQLIAAVISAVLGIILIALAVSLRTHSTRSVAVDEPLPELREAKSRYETSKNAFDAHEKLLRTEATRLRFSWPVSEKDLMERESQIGASERALENARTLSEQLRELRSKKFARNSDFRKAMKDLDHAGNSLSLLDQQWMGFLRKRNLPSVQPETAIAIFAKVKEARQILKSQEVNSSEANKQVQKVQAYLEDLRACLISADLPVGNDASTALSQFTNLREDILLQKELARKRAELVRQMDEARDSFKNAVRIKRISRQALLDLFNNAGVNDENGFKNLSERFSRHTELTQEIRAKDTGLETIFGQNGIPNELREALSPGPRPDWETDRAQRQNEKDSLKNRHEDSLRKKTTLESDVNAQLRSEEIAFLRLESEGLEEELRQGIEDWLQLATAQELLRRTRQRFELENQTPALAEASRLFKIVTAGCYEKIIVPFDSKAADLTISTKMPPALTPQQLSRGTLEQLYLCIRLGYIRHFQKQRGESLPLLMDDVAVNFDPQRMENTFEVLSDCCRDGQQILFFTCHSDLIRLLRPGDRCFSINHFRFERKAIGPLVSSTSA